MTFVTVSVPLALALLAGFNNALGFTTFGKTPDTPPPPVQPPPVPARSCSNHSECRALPQTSCIASEPRSPSKRYCLCGNNKPPVNGFCSPGKKGPNHMCSNTDDCVEDAECLPMMKAPEQNAVGPAKVCKCKEDLYPYDNECNSGTKIETPLSIIMILLCLWRTLY